MPVEIKHKIKKRKKLMNSMEIFNKQNIWKAVFTIISDKKIYFLMVKIYLHYLF
jgi:hypothetical protein